MSWVSLSPKATGTSLLKMAQNLRNTWRQQLTKIKKPIPRIASASSRSKTCLFHLPRLNQNWCLDKQSKTLKVTLPSHSRYEDKLDTSIKLMKKLFEDVTLYKVRLEWCPILCQTEKIRSKEYVASQNRHNTAQLLYSNFSCTFLLIYLKRKLWCPQILKRNQRNCFLISGLRI